MQQDIKTYIEGAWTLLSRSSLDCGFDSKVEGDKALLYISSSENPETILHQIEERQKHSGASLSIDLRVLTQSPKEMQEHGLLYLPNDYIIPGGRFNEMYGWDSYWIVLGLLYDGKIALAKGIVENCFYEIEHYGGKVLNANRTYYLTRSQPPVLGPMVMAVAAHLKGKERHSFLLRAEKDLALNYRTFWKRKRYVRKTRLFRYGHPDRAAFGFCPEVLFGEQNAEGQSHYQIIASHLRSLSAHDPLRHRLYDAERDTLTAFAVASDRALRESGFDPSMHFGFYGLETLDYNPVCLNTLLYVQCQTLELINRYLRRAPQARDWRAESHTLKERIQQVLWNESTGFFSDYNFHKNEASDFPYLTCAYPLWAGIATKEQASRFQEQLSRFEMPYGLTASPRKTGCQWDGPYMWAPLTYFTVHGLRRYGYVEDAQRLESKFLSTVGHVFDEQGALFEKYNAETGSNQTQDVDVGYYVNVVGFGWTNGVARDFQQRTDTL